MEKHEIEQPTRFHKVAPRKGAVTLSPIQRNNGRLQPGARDATQKAVERLAMVSGEAGDDPRLDPLPRRDPNERIRWGRRSSRYENSGEDRGGATYAALDLGTNNCRLLIARPAGDSFRVVDAFSRIIRLGEGVSLSGRLSEAAIERALAALAICRSKMRNKGVTRSRLIATEACRAAGNGDNFRARVARELGLDLEIIDRATEAELAATGCTPLIAEDAEGVILFDIGGGSSELVRLSRPLASESGPPRPSTTCFTPVRSKAIPPSDGRSPHRTR